MKSTLFRCPDCDYQCSPNALSCLNCGHIFRISQTVDRRPRINPVIWIVTLSIVSLAVFSTIGLVMNAARETAEFDAAQNDSTSTATQTAIEARRRFASERQAAVLNNLDKNPPDLIYETEDYLEKSDSLIVTGSTLMKKDCDLLANENDGRAAAGLGFNRVICRNRRLRSEWSLHLEKPAPTSTRSQTASGK